MDNALLLCFLLFSIDNLFDVIGVSNRLDFLAK